MCHTVLSSQKELKLEFFVVQVYAMPVFDMIERSTVKRLSISRGLMLRLIVRSAYVGESFAG